MRGDDYVGSFIAKALMNVARANDVILFDVEDSIEWVILKIAKCTPKHVILIDACEMNLDAGEVSLIPLAETNYPFFTTHGIPLKLLATKFIPKAETWILAIQPQLMQFTGAQSTLSSPVLAAANSVSKFIGSILEERRLDA
jgi:hydrogenase maturation protease